MAKKPEFGPHPRPGARGSSIISTSAKGTTPIVNKSARCARTAFLSKASSFESIEFDSSYRIYSSTILGG